MGGQCRDSSRPVAFARDLSGKVVSPDINVPATAASMKVMPHGSAARSRLWSIASAAAAILLAGYAAAFFMYLNVIWNPSYYGELGLSVNAGSRTVDQVVPGSPADRTGIKVGDTVEPPKMLRDRLILFPDCLQRGSNSNNSS